MTIHEGKRKANFAAEIMNRYDPEIMRFWYLSKSPLENACAAILWGYKHKIKNLF